MVRWLAALLLLVMAGTAQALQPGETLDDPALEARARAISLELRCMVCQNQSIEDSDAELARDLRVLVRDRLVAGDTDRQVMDFVVARYGEFVLLRPRFNARNLLLWAAPVLLLGAGLAFAWTQARRRKASGPPLSRDEEERLSRIMDAQD